jgi:hypothetical protein
MAEPHPLYYPVLISHVALMIFLLCGWVFSSEYFVSPEVGRWILRVLFVSLIVTISMYVVFNGCVVTKLERKLSRSEDDFTVIDPLLHSLGINITRKTRSVISLTLFVLSLAITTKLLCDSLNYLPIVDPEVH